MYVHVQVTSQLEYFMQTITSAVKLMDTRLVHINTKLTEIARRQDVMEMSLKLVHESIRKISTPVHVSAAAKSQSSPAAPASSLQSCSSPAQQNCDDNPWWMTDSLMEQTTSVEPAVPPANPPPTLSAPEISGDQPRVQPPPAPLTAPGDQQLPPSAFASSGDQQHPPPPPTTPKANNLPQFLSAEELIAIRTASVSQRNFAANVNCKILSEEERMTSNVSGSKGKDELDPIKVAYIKRVTFQQYPLKGNEKEKKVWSDCIISIDEVNRQLNQNTQKH